MRNLLLVSSLFAFALYPQTPAVSSGGIVNHFSYASPGLPNGSLAQGSIFDIYGANLGPAQLTQFSGFPVPDNIAGTSVEITVAGTTTKALLFFVSRSQVVGILPSKTPTGTGTLTVVVNGARSAPAPVTVSTRSIGILSLNQAGSGPAVMQMPDAAGNVPLNTVDRPARPGQIGVFYGTGAGPVPFEDSGAAPFQNLNTNVRVLVGGTEAKVLFLGRTPGFAGLDQFNVEIPAGTSGCYVPVVFRMGDVLSNYTSISVSPSGPCPDPIPTTPTPNSGTQRVGSVQLVHTESIGFTGTGVGPIVGDVGVASFTSTDYSKIKPTVPPIFTTIGSCTVAAFPQAQGVDNTGALAFLDGGAVVNVSGPNGSRQLAKNAFGFASQLAAGYLVPGTYTVDNGAGSGQVGAFQAVINIPPPLVWTNAQHLQEIPRNAPWEVRWTGGAPGTEVYIGGTGLLPEAAGRPAAGATFTCRAPASAGRFTIPEVVLLALPPSTVTQGVSSGALSINNGTTPVRFTGSHGLDETLASYTVGITRNVVFK